MRSPVPEAGDMVSPGSGFTTGRMEYSFIANSKLFR
jgi:hypothetical protein